MNGSRASTRPSDASPPRISVIICTYNRPSMLSNALASVLDQDIDEPYEVIVIDDGSEPPVQILKQARTPIRLVRTPHRGIGTARAEGLAAATGEFVAWCDDDDLWSRHHLRILHDYLVANPDVALVYGDSEWIEDNQWRYVPYSQPHDGSLLKDSQYIFASDVMFRTAAAREAGGFDPDLQAAEDWDLWLRMSLHKALLRHIPQVIGAHRWHDQNLSGSDIFSAARDTVIGRHRTRLGEAGDAELHGIVVDSAPRRPFDPSTWSESRRQLIWHAVMRSNEGYGSVAQQLLLALEQRGVELIIPPTRNQPLPGFERFHRPLDHWGRMGFYYDYVDRPGVLPCERIIHYAMAETNHVIPAKVEQINLANSLLYVPCSHNVEVFQACGVRVPIRVLPHGVDTQNFDLIHRPRRETFTFGTFGALSLRKGIDLLVRAFQDEFKPNEPVRLLMKTVSAPQSWGIRDPRIKIKGGYLGKGPLLDLLGEMDVFVMPSRGEGFGLCGLEAMATGMPLIATNWSGPADYLDPDDSFPLSYRLVDARGVEAHGMNFYGQWAEPDYEHLRHLMRYAFEHRDEAMAMGLRAAERVRHKWTWARVAEQMCADLDQLAVEWARPQEVCA